MTHPTPNCLDMSSWLDWDSLAKSAGDAAETTRLMALRASKHAEIMYCESQMKSALSQFGQDAFPAMEADDSERVKALFVAVKALVDGHRADIRAKREEIESIEAEMARVGQETNGAASAAVANAAAASAPTTTTANEV